MLLNIIVILLWNFLIAVLYLLRAPIEKTVLSIQQKYFVAGSWIKLICYANKKFWEINNIFSNQRNFFKDNNKIWLHKYKNILHGENFYINFYYSTFQFREKRITFRIFVSKNTQPICVERVSKQDRFGNFR